MNKVLKKKWIIGAAVILGIAVLAVLNFVLNPVSVSGIGGSGEVVFNYEGISVREELTASESRELAEILNGKILYFDNPSCGFTEDVSLRFGNKVFCPANDMCSTVKFGNKYLSPSGDEMRIIRKIMTNHGAKFPCV